MNSIVWQRSIVHESTDGKYKIVGDYNCYMAMYESAKIRLDGKTTRIYGSLQECKKACEQHILKK